MLRSSRTRLTRAEGQAILRSAFGDAAAPASRATRPGPSCPSLTSSPFPGRPSGSLGTGSAAAPSTPASSTLPLSWTPVPTSSSFLSPATSVISPVGSFVGQHSHLPLSSVIQLLPRSFASQAAAAAASTAVSNPLRHALLRAATYPGIASSSSSIVSSSVRSFAPSSFTPSSRLFSSSSSSASAAPPSGFLSWYLAFLDSHPVLTKALTASTIFTVADITSQFLAHTVDGRAQASGDSLSPAAGTDSLAVETRGFKWDLARTLRMSAAGFVLSGPTLHVWYGLMARWRPGRDASSIVQKILAGTFLYGPVFNAAFFSSNAALQGEGSREIAGRLKRDVIPTCVNGLMYWPFCDALTYRFVPVHLQQLRPTPSGPRSLHSLSRLGASSEEVRHYQHAQQQEERGEGVGRSWSLAQTCHELSFLLRPTVSTASGFPSSVPSHQSSPFSRFQPAATLSTACHGSASLAASNQPQLHPFQSSRSPSHSPSPFSRFQPSASLSTAHHRLPQPSVGLRGVPVSFGVAPLESEMRGSVLGPAWAGAGRARGFVQLRTILTVADNSGAKRVMCIKVLKGAKPNAAVVGDIIICSVRDADFHGKVKKGEVVTCVVVRSAMVKRRSDGSMIRFDGPAAVVINKAGEPIGTRVFGPVPHELRRKKLVKVLALAQLVT